MPRAKSATPKKSAATGSGAFISPKLFQFMGELKANNTRDWFTENKPRYEEHVKEPLLAFITAFAHPLAKISKKFTAAPRGVGGSLFRIYRDTRFSKDKTPYKTHAGVHFKHANAKSVHAPGFYLHLEPTEVFCGVGIWHPDTATANLIRQAIADDPAAWKKASRGAKFAKAFELGGESLKRPPRGFDPEHAFIDDLKRKEFIASTRFTRKQACAPDFLDRFADACRTAAPFVAFLTRAVNQPW